MMRLLFLAAAMLLSCSLTAGCSESTGFTACGYDAESGEVREIVIDVRDRAVDVSPSDDEELHIAYYESGEEGYDMMIEDGVLIMESRVSRDWTDYIGFKTPEAYRAISVELSDGIECLTISTTNEEVTIRNIAVKTAVNLSSNGGDIILEKLDAGERISLNAKNGDISGSITGGYDDFSITADTKKGDCNLMEKDGGEKTLHVSCNNGDVDVVFAR